METIHISTEDADYTFEMIQTSNYTPARMNYGGLPDPAEPPTFGVESVERVDLETGETSSNAPDEVLDEAVRRAQCRARA